MHEKSRNLVIDTLRILSALSVFLFHVGVFPYGYWGVDIFFLLSGYVLTKRTEERSETHSALQILRERVIRLLPSLLIISMITCLLFAWISAPDKYISIVRTALSALVGISNIDLTLSEQYFASHNTPNPLLHLWSISTEFWFYMIFALLASRGVWLKHLTMITFSAFLLNIAFQTMAKEIHDFYMLGIDRFYIFCLGASCYVLREKFRQLAIITSLPLLIYITTAYNSWVALSSVPVVLGAIVLISLVDSVAWRNYKSDLFSRVSRSSYEFYLIHFPMKVLLFDYLQVARNFASIAVVFLLLVVAALFFNHLSTKHRTHFFILYPISIISLLIVITGLLMKSNSLGADEKRLDGFAGEQCERELAHCETKGMLPNAFLYGDSNARQLVSLPLELGFGITHLSSNCVLSLCVKDPVLYPDHQWNDTHLGQIADSQSPVVIGYLWRKFFKSEVYINGEPKTPSQEELAKIIADDVMRLASSKNRKIILVGQFPGTHYSTRYEECSVLKGEEYCSSSKDNFAVFNSTMESLLTGKKNVIFINPSSIMCASVGSCKNVHDGKALYHDENHLSGYGMKYLIDHMKESRLNIF